MTDDQTPTANETPEVKPESTEPAPVAETVELAAAPEPEAVAAPEPAVPVTAAVDEKPRVDSKGGFCWGTGRRKSAVARVRIRAGDGKFIINKREINDFFRLKQDQDAIIAPLVATDAAKRVDVFVNVGGGGITGQSGAIVLGVARALCKLNDEYEAVLREGQFLTRDSRVVERKKYGQRGARRRFQFSKR